MYSRQVVIKGALCANAIMLKQYLYNIINAIGEKGIRILGRLSAISDLGRKRNLFALDSFLNISP